ncbi:hypothetical protein [Candidatus Cardinium hertigii]|jgi:hypothetical protein|uniref:Peptidyl-prolyl cis-trans isomerase n=1 Tax=Candidatus Cardinium hertigii TaxID=247481 RepID=A0A3N2QD06_9BACT|nr:hypothetical protein [Candidatus Cardinium hertigii]ROT47657.1 hypothetical protein EDM02_01285 [Candidatus Cardinium hertigii]
MVRLNKLAAYGFLLIAAYLIMRNCGSEKKTQDPQQSSFIARVGNQYLYASDLAALDIAHMEASDKSTFLNQYVEEWAFKQLLIAQGSKEFPSVQSSIESKINTYKNDLLAQHFLEIFVERAFNNEVSPAEIADYYEKHKRKDFILNHDIVKGIFLAIPKRAAGINSVKSLMLSKKPSDQKKIQAYCKPYANTTILAADKWFAWEAVLAKIGHPPLGDYGANSTRLLKTNKFIHVAARKYLYLLRIDQYKTASEITPLEMVEERIRAIILHKRRLALVTKIKHNFLQNAKNNHTCLIQAN